MAKKKTPKMPVTAEPKLRPVRLDISQEDHDRLRMQAAKSRLSMAAFCRMVLMKAIEDLEAAEE